MDAPARRIDGDDFVVAEAHPPWRSQRFGQRPPPDARLAVRRLVQTLVMAGVDEAFLHAVVARLVGWQPPPAEYGLLETVEVAHVDGRPAVAMTWTQKYLGGTQQRFGLLLSIDQLPHEDAAVGDVDSLVFYLQLAVVEPHGGGGPGRHPFTPGRHWFTTLP